MPRALLERWRARRRLYGFAPLTASSPEGGRVKISGTVRVLDETVTAPLSAVECVVVRTRVQGKPYMRAMFGWQDELWVRPFAVEITAGSRVIVDGSHVLLGVRSVDIARTSSDRRWAYMARHALDPKSGSKFAEQVVEPGDRVTVGGVLLRDVSFEPPKHERVFREQLPPGLRLVGSEEHPLVIVGHR